MDPTQQVQRLQGGVPSGGARGGGANMAFILLRNPIAIAFVVVFVLTLIVLAITFWQAYKKTGRQPALGLLMLIPVVNIGVAIHFAFTEWPILKELSRLKLATAEVHEEPVIP